MSYFKRHIKVIIISLCLILTVQGCSTQGPVKESANNDKEKNVFMYDSTKPFNEKEISVKDEEGVKVHEISYDSYDTEINSGKINAYLVVPEGDGPFPAVLYVHWLGNVNSNKKEFLNDAIEMAKKGAVGLLIDGYFPWMNTPNGTDKDRASIIYQVIEVRRAVDYLTNLPYVDSKNLAYVGHDYGAMYGAIMSGIDKRIGSYDLITGMGNFADWFLTYWVKNSNDEYLKSLSDLDPIMYIGKAAPSKLFFQFATNDKFITKSVADEFYQAASDPKEEKFYDGGHRMNTDEAKADRIKWLSDCLGIK